MVDFDPPHPNYADISSISGCVGLRACLDALPSRKFSSSRGCHFAHHKYHMYYPGIELDPPRREAGD